MGGLHQVRTLPLLFWVVWGKGDNGVGVRDPEVLKLCRFGCPCKLSHKWVVHCVSSCSARSGPEQDTLIKVFSMLCWGNSSGETFSLSSIQARDRCCWRSLV